MGVWTRMRKIISSRRADDPASLRSDLDETYRGYLAQLQQVQRSVADVSVSRRRVEVRLNQMTQQAGQLEEQAQQAVNDGDDDGARAALARKLTLEKALGDLTAQRDTLAAEEQRLQAAASSLEGQIEDFRVRKDTLVARHDAAQAQTQINQSGLNSSLSEVNQRMDQASRHTRELEAQVDAVDELVADGVISRPGESEIEAELRRFDAALADGPDLSADQDSDAALESRSDSGSALESGGSMDSSKGDPHGPH